MDSKHTWESGHNLFSNDNFNDNDIDSDEHSCLSEQRKVAAVVDSTTTIRAVVTETIVDYKAIDIDSGVTVASTSKGDQNTGSLMETGVCEEAVSPTITEKKRGQQKKAADKSSLNEPVTRGTLMLDGKKWQCCRTNPAV